MNIHAVNDAHQHIDIVYHATTSHTNVVPENPTGKWEWLTKEEVEKHPTLSDRVRTYALGALATYAQAS